MSIGTNVYENLVTLSQTCSRLENTLTLLLKISISGSQFFGLINDQLQKKLNGNHNNTVQEIVIFKLLEFTERIIVYVHLLINSCGTYESIQSSTCHQ